MVLNKAKSDETTASTTTSSESVIEGQETETPAVVATADIGFFSLLPAQVLQKLLEQGITSPTPVQQQSFGPASEGRDIIAESRTGSGKTLAFALPSALRLQASRSQEPRTSGNEKPRMLVLAPTRELADQVSNVFQTTLSTLNFRTVSITGGSSYTRQMSALRRGVDVVVGTPGRIVDLMEQKILDLSGIEIFVLDEVDQMLDFGFAESLALIRDSLPKQKQTLFFSATFNPKISSIARTMLTNPFEVRIAKSDISTGSIEHGYIEVAPGRNLEALVNTLLFHEPSQAIIFCQTKQECSDVHRALLTRGIEAGMLNGDMKQSDRTVTMDQFKLKRLRFLVATDVAARGIDVSDLSHVINYNVPDRADSYTHRSGRTGRAGATGKAWTIVTPGEARNFEFILQRTKIVPTKIEVPSSADIAGKALQNLSSSLGAFEKTSSHMVETIVNDYVTTLSVEDIKAHFQAMVKLHLSRSATSGFDLKMIVPNRPLVRIGGASASAGGGREFGGSSSGGQYSGSRGGARGGEGRSYGGGRGGREFGGSSSGGFKGRSSGGSSAGSSYPKTSPSSAPAAASGRFPKAAAPSPVAAKTAKVGAPAPKSARPESWFS